MSIAQCSETVYSVEEEEPKQKSEEKTEEEAANNEEVAETEPEKEKVKEEIEIGKTDEISETTEYDCTTDDESLKMIFSSTDQSNCCSGVVFTSMQILESLRSRKLCPRNLFPSVQLRVVPRPPGQVQEPGGSQQDQTHREEEEAPPQPPERLPGLC